MKRPLSEVRPIGPFTEKLNFSSNNDEDVDYTMLYAAPGIPSHVDAPEEMIMSFTSLVERTLRMELGLSNSQYNVFTESIVAEKLRQDGNMLVVKLMGVDLTESEAIEATEVVGEDIEDKTGVRNPDSAVFTNDFFLDSNVEQLD